MDAPSLVRLSYVHPLLRDKVQQLAQALEQQGVTIRVTQGLRTWQQQNALYAQGRTAPGKIVTNVPGGSSWHNFGLAVDVVPDSAQDDGVFIPDWNVDHPDWQLITTAGTNLGMVSGASWRTFKDWPHLQMTGRFPESPNDEVRAIYQASGLKGVWDAAQLAAPPQSEISRA